MCVDNQSVILKIAKNPKVWLSRAKIWQNLVKHGKNPEG
jgi:hypothetical protein